MAIVGLEPIFMKANPSSEIGYGLGSAIPACALSQGLIRIHHVGRIQVVGQSQLGEQSWAKAIWKVMIPV